MCLHRAADGDSKQCIEQLDATLQYLVNLNLELIICGDTNINYLVKETPTKCTNNIYFLNYCTYMFRSPLTIIRLLVVTEYSNSTICAFVQDIIIYNCVMQIQTIVLFLKN